MIDETRIEGALREGPPFRTHYVPGSLTTGRAALRPVPLRASWVLVAVLLLLALIVAGGALIGSGVIKLPVPVKPSAVWTRSGTLNEARFGPAAVLLSDGRVLVAGGIGERPGGWETRSSELYDPGSGRWSPTGDMTHARLPGFTATLLEDGAVLAVGWDAAGDLYDPARGTWRATRPMITSRGDHSATLLPNGSVLLAGGVGPGGTLDSAELYDPASGTWAATGSMVEARQGHAAVRLSNGMVLVAGGSRNGIAVASAELYDPETGTWREIGPAGFPPDDGDAGLPQIAAAALPDGRALLVGPRAMARIYDATSDAFSPAATPIGFSSRHTATPLDDGRVLVVGDDGSAAEFDPTSGAWTQVASMIDAAAAPGHTATLLVDGRLLVVGGGGFNDPERGIRYPAELFGPAPVTSSPVASASLPVRGGGWTTVGILGTGRVAHTATLLPDSRVLVAGGNRVSGGSLGVTPPLEEAAAEIFDPAGRPAFTATASMATGRSGHTATLLPNGLVLVAGGRGDAGTLASAELFDPANGLWRATGTMATPRALHAAVLLQSGLVLVVGGLRQTSGPEMAALDSAELYDPVTGIWAPAASMVDARGAFTATLLVDGRVLVAGGTRDQRDLPTVEIYDPTLQSWSVAAPPAGPLLGHSATLLVDGSVLVVGGWHSGNGTLESRVLLYDPIGDAWTRVADLPEARGGQTATLLGDGRVLIVGGLGNGPNVACGLVVNSAVLYDAAARAWIPAGAMSVARYDQVATRLHDGSVLITGGARNICQNDAVDLAELFTPGSGN